MNSGISVGRERVSESENLGMIGQIRNHLVYYLVPLGALPKIIRLHPNLGTVIRAELGFLLS